MGRFLYPPEREGKMNEVEQGLFQVASDALYMKSEMIRFLLVENLALKTLLHQKGVITPEEFAEQKVLAAKLLDAAMKEKVKAQISVLLPHLDVSLVASEPSSEASPERPQSEQ